MGESTAAGDPSASDVEADRDAEEPFPRPGPISRSPSMPSIPGFSRQMPGLGLSSLLGKVGLPGLHERAFSPEGTWGAGRQ